MHRIALRDDCLHVGPYFAVSFQRTLRIPDDGREYPLPPGLGRFPLRRVRDHARRVPAAWRETGGVFLPMYQREALWLSFEGAYWHPCAVKIGVGAVNAISGGPWDARLRRRPQDYVVAPHQPWLDGINAGEGFIRQFVAVPLGSGLSVEAQVSGEEEEGGIRLTVVEARPGVFPTRGPRRRERMLSMCCEAAPAYAMGLGAGGRMRQSIYPDPHPRGTWDAARSATVHVHIADSATWKSITGEEPPPSPISARTYTQYGLPWFALYDERKGRVGASKILGGVRSVTEIEGGEDEAVEIAAGQVVGIGG